MGKRSTCTTRAACAGGEGGGETRGERLQQGIAAKTKGHRCTRGVHLVCTLFLGAHQPRHPSPRGIAREWTVCSVGRSVVMTD